MSGQRPYGLVAEFDAPEALLEAAKATRRAGYSRLDAFTPFPNRDIAEALGFRRSWLRFLPWLAVLVGGAVQYYSQYWMNVIDYPINVGGRPLHSWPAFIPATIIVSVLWGGVATFLVMLFETRLPRLHHPIFDTPDFERASQDRFFLLVKADDPRFDSETTTSLLAQFAPRAIRELPS